MVDAKQLVFNAVSPLSFNLTDNPHPYQKNAYSILRVLVNRPSHKKNYVNGHWLMRLDCFSTYKGEAQIRAYLESVETALQTLYNNSAVVEVECQYQIMDDDEKGPIVKHGVMSITVNTMEVE